MSVVRVGERLLVRGATAEGREHAPLPGVDEPAPGTRPDGVIAINSVGEPVVFDLDGDAHPADGTRRRSPMNERDGPVAGLEPDNWILAGARLRILDPAMDALTLYLPRTDRDGVKPKPISFACEGRIVRRVEVRRDEPTDVPVDPEWRDKTLVVIGETEDERLDERPLIALCILKNE